MLNASQPEAHEVDGKNSPLTAVVEMGLVGVTQSADTGPPVSPPPAVVDA